VPDRSYGVSAGKPAAPSGARAAVVALQAALRRELYVTPYESIAWDAQRNNCAEIDLYAPHTVGGRRQERQCMDGCVARPPLNAHACAFPRPLGCLCSG
jgi:hypothetical protein